MSVIATLIEPERVTRIFFDYRRSDNGRQEEARIARAIAQASAADAEPQPRQAA
jgi:hypothetical protein